MTVDFVWRRVMKSNMGKENSDAADGQVQDDEEHRVSN